MTQRIDSLPWLNLPVSPIERAAASDATRLALTCLHWKDDLGHWLASDGFVLAASPAKSGDQTPPANIAIPQDVVKLARTGRNSPTVRYDPGQSYENPPTFYYLKDGLILTAQHTDPQKFPDPQDILRVRLPWLDWDNGQTPKPPAARPLATFDARLLADLAHKTYSRVDKEDSQVQPDDWPQDLRAEDRRVKDRKRERANMYPISWHYDPVYQQVYHRPWTDGPHSQPQDPDPWPTFTMDLAEQWTYHTDGQDVDGPPRDNLGRETERIFSLDVKKLTNLAKAITLPGRDRTTKRHTHMITLWTDPRQTPTGSQPLIVSEPWTAEEPDPRRPRAWGLVMPVYQR